MKRRVLRRAAAVGAYFGLMALLTLMFWSLVQPVPLRIGLPAIGVAFVIGFVVVVALALFGPTDPIELDGDGS